MNVRAVLVAIGCLATGIAFAGPMGYAHGGPDIEKLALLLDLNDRQKTEVQKVLDAQHEQMRAAREQARSAAERPSRDEMRARHEALRQETRTKLGAILDEKQMKKFDALTEHSHGRKGEHGRTNESAFCHGSRQLSWEVPCISPPSTAKITSAALP